MASPAAAPGLRSLRDRPRRLLAADPGLVIVVGAAALLGLAYAVWAWQRHRWYLTAGFDLGIFDQAAWRMAHLRVPATTLRVEDNLWGDHFHPIIVLWGALRAIWPSALALLVSQALLVAAAMVPLYLVARDRAGRAPGVLVALAYGTSWGVQQAIAFDVHEVAFAPVLLASAVLAADRRRWRWFWVCVVALLCVKEDVSLLVVALGLWLLLTGERRRGLAAVVLGIAWFVVVTRLVIPSLGVVGFQYWSYDAFGDDAFSALGNLLTHPWKVVTVAIDPREKLDTMIALVAPFLFVTPWLTRLAVLPLPLFAERFLSDQPNYWNTSFHYSLLPTMALAIAAAGGIGTIRRWVARHGNGDGGATAPVRATDAAATAAAAGAADPADPPAARGGPNRRRRTSVPTLVATAVATAGLLVGVGWWSTAFGTSVVPLRSMAQLDPPPRTVDRELLDRVVAAVPDSGSIAAPRTLQPHLTGRGQDVLLLQSPRNGYPTGTSRADNVVLNLVSSAGTDPVGSGDPNDLRLLMVGVEERQARGDLALHALFPGGWAVLRSPRAPGGVAPVPGIGPLPAPAARALRVAVARWVRRTNAIFEGCAFGCPAGSTERWRAATADQTTALRVAADAASGGCRDLLATAATADDQPLAALAEATARPSAQSGAVLTAALTQTSISASRRAALACGAADDTAIPPLGLARPG
jgi:uncharacterized membrane protein